MGFNKVFKASELGRMALAQRSSRLKLVRNLLLALLALEMGKNKALVKAERSDHISLSNLLASKLPQRDELLRQPLLRCALLGNTRSRQDCEQQLLYFLNEISQESRPITQITTPPQQNNGVRPQRPLSLRGLNPIEYLNLIQNCISKCDGWGSRVDYQNCLKSCQRENSLLQHLDPSHSQGGSLECVKAPCGRGRPSELSLDQMSGPCASGLLCDQPSWIDRTTARKRRQDENCSGALCNLDQLRKRRWGDTLTTCIASYCNTLNGVSRVDCIINKCDKQRRG